MPDQNDNQNPPQTPQLPVVVSRSWTDDLKLTIATLWAKYSIFFILVGLVLLIARFGSVMIKIYAWLSKKEVEDTKKETAQLKVEEDAANKKANDLVAKANDLPKQEGTVDENWDRKK